MKPYDFPVNRMLSDEVLFNERKITTTPDEIDIEVRLQDIYEGKKGDANLCPIALACRRAGIPDNVIVEGTIVEFTPTTTGNWCVSSLYYNLPPTASQFIDRFDKGDEEVLPFKFKMHRREPDYSL